MLFSRRYSQGATLKVLLSRCYSWGATLKALLSRCYSWGATLKALLLRSYSRGARFRHSIGFWMFRVFRDNFFYSALVFVFFFVICDKEKLLYLTLLQRTGWYMTILCALGDQTIRTGKRENTYCGCYRGEGVIIVNFSFIYWYIIYMYGLGFKGMGTC